MRGLRCLSGVIRERWRRSTFTTRCAAGTVSAAVDDDSTVGTYEVRKTRCLSTRVRRRKQLLLAEAALEQRAESCASTFGVGSPWSRLKRRLVTYVPLVPTSELGNPVAMLVLVVSDDLAQHRVRVRRADGPAPAPRLTQGAFPHTGADQAYVLAIQLWQIVPVNDQFPQLPSRPPGRDGPRTSSLRYATGPEGVQRPKLEARSSMWTGVP